MDGRRNRFSQSGLLPALTSSIPVHDECDLSHGPVPLVTAIGSVPPDHDTMVQYVADSALSTSRLKLSIFLGDIADAPADAVCTSTNPRLSLVMGTGASVRSRGGPAVSRACEALLAGRPALPAGTAFTTTAGSLPHKLAIHCVASTTAHRSSAAIVRSCVRQVLAHADAAQCASIALPVLGAGHARLPFAEAVRAMASIMIGADTRVRQIIFVTNDDECAGELQAILQEMAGSPVNLVRSAKLEPESEGSWADVYTPRLD